METRKVKTLTRTFKVGKWSVTRRRGSEDGSVKWRFPWKIVAQTRHAERGGGRKGKYGMRGEIFLREANHLFYFSFSPSFELCKSRVPTEAEAHVTGKTESKIWCQNTQNRNQGGPRVPKNGSTEVSLILRKHI